MMQTDAKIKEATFFLNKIRTNSDNFPDVYYYFSAFLNSTKSISDYLLEEFRQKYNLDISLNTRSFENDFKKRAEEKDQNGDSRSLEFFTWYRQRIETIKKDKTGSVMIMKRHHNIHRRLTLPTQLLIMSPPREANVGIISTFQPPNGASIDDRQLEKIINDLCNRLLDTVNSKLPAGSKSITTIKQTKVLTLPELEFFDLVDSCKKFLCIMKIMVQEARRQFPT